MYTNTTINTQRLERLKSRLKEIGHPKRAPFHPHAAAVPGGRPPSGGQQQQQQQISQQPTRDSSSSLSSTLGAYVRLFDVMMCKGSRGRQS